MRLGSLQRALLLGLALALGGSPAIAQASHAKLSGRGAYTFKSMVSRLHLKTKTCPGRLGNPATRCAVSSRNLANLQKQLSAWKGWKQTDPWEAGSTTFTSNGKDLYVLTVMPRLDSQRGSLVIFSEF